MKTCLFVAMCARASGSWGDCFFFQAEDGIRDGTVTGVQTCALPISAQGLGIVMPEQGEQQVLGADVRVMGRCGDAVGLVQAEAEGRVGSRLLDLGSVGPRL